MNADENDRYIKAVHEELFLSDEESPYTLDQKGKRAAIKQRDTIEANIINLTMLSNTLRKVILHGGEVNTVEIDIEEIDAELTEVLFKTKKLLLEDIKNIIYKEQRKRRNFFLQAVIMFFSAWCSYWIAFTLSAMEAQFIVFTVDIFPLAMISVGIMLPVAIMYYFTIYQNR